MTQINPYLDDVRKAIESDFLTLNTEGKSTFIAAFGMEAAKLDFAGCTLPQLWSMEIFIIKCLTKDELSRRMWIIREKFRLLAGETVYQAYVDRLPNTITDNSLKQDITNDDYLILKEDAVNLARQMQRMMYYRMQRNVAINVKKKFPIWLFMTILVVGGIVIYIYPNDTATGKSWDLLLLMVHFGMTGAVISLIQRLERASNMSTNFTDSAINSTDIDEGMSKFYMISLVVSGAVFSVLVYLLSRSQWVNFFDLLPKPISTPQCDFCNTTNTQEFTSKFFCAQFSSMDMAKLLILSFISGFAERFVPDVLDSLIQRSPAIKK